MSASEVRVNMPVYVSMTLTAPKQFFLIISNDAETMIVCTKL